MSNKIEKITDDYYVVCTMSDDSEIPIECCYMEYRGNDKFILVPNDVDKCSPDAFIDVPSDAKISFPDSYTEFEELHFNNGTPEILFPSTLKAANPIGIKSGNIKKFEIINEQTLFYLRMNPDIKIIDGFLINTANNTLLFNIDYSRKEAKVPYFVEHIAKKAWNEEWLDQTIDWTDGWSKESFNEYKKIIRKFSCIEKIYLPSTIKSVHKDAFYCCKKLVAVEKYQVENVNNKKITHRMLERLIRIHNKIKSGCYPNSRQLAYDLEASEPTINRDIEYLRDSRGAPIEYDYTQKGYYYTEEYELKF